MNYQNPKLDPNLSQQFSRNSNQNPKGFLRYLVFGLMVFFGIVSYFFSDNLFKLNREVIQENRNSINNYSSKEEKEEANLSSNQAANHLNVQESSEINSQTTEEKTEEKTYNAIEEPYLGDVENVFFKMQEANKNCDIKAQEKLVSEKSNEILRGNCQAMKREWECLPKQDYEIKIKDNEAILFYTPYSHNGTNPFYFIKENNTWKVDYYRMSQEISLVGSGCNSGWNWRNQQSATYICQFFKNSECPE